jgi:A/G-specific adenine glycosylase
LKTKEEVDFDFIAEQLNELLFKANIKGVMACNEKSIIHKLSHQFIY